MFYKKGNKNHTYPRISSEMREKATDKELLGLMPWNLVKDFKAFLLAKNSQQVKVAAFDPNNPALRNFIKERFGGQVSWFQAVEEDINFVLQSYNRDFQKEILELANSDGEKNRHIAAITDSIIRYALSEKASDIHIEPLRHSLKIRFRIDGFLHTVLELPKNIYQPLTARIKIMANMKIDEYRRPQDGRIEPEGLDATSLRVSTVPALFGEKIAMRILDESNKNLSIDELGLSAEEEKMIVDNIEKPFGMIISSGPTGSGKTTTLYSLLQQIKKDGINISTLEDPVEYILEGVNQIQINPRVKLTFPSGLRSLLRQDPDIIMVGEIRDSETAIMAAGAALTGHLVFTTLHTNDSSSAFTRFLEMGVEDFVVSSTINLVIGQRLLRKICPFCREESVLDPVIIQKIKERPDVLTALEAKEKGLAKNFEKMAFKKGKGCPSCFQSGYLGRIGIFELLVPNKKIHDLILKHESSEKIKEAALEAGFKDMISSGLEKVFRGQTTFSELMRTTKNV